MNTELIGVLAIIVLSITFAYPLGKYISKVFKEEKIWSDFLLPVEKLIFKLSGIDTRVQMDWKENVRAMLRINTVFYVWGISILMIQGYIPFLNPTKAHSMEPTLAFNTAISFVTNTNLQHYSGETGLSYFSQFFVIGFLQFVTAATGIAVLALLFNGINNNKNGNIGNFYSLFVKSCTRILLPISLVVSIIILLNGTPATLNGNQKVITLEGDTCYVSTGPVAPIVAIKQIGTNGGGFFGTNSAHPFENPNYFTNAIENISILLIPIALVFTFGFTTNNKKLAWVFWGVMTIMFFVFVSVAINFESTSNHELTKLGISQPIGNTEGKEIRIGSYASALWGVSTTSTSNGSVNSMHDNVMPLTGGVYMLDMMINSIYGGVGVGFINFFMFVIIAVFISGLMVGRTPEFLGKKIEIKEVKIASLIILLHPLLILVGAAISTYIITKNSQLAWLNNSSFHGFSEMLYEFVSAAANNGSGFEGLGDNTPFWNIATGIVMLLGRYIPIIGPMAIIGSLSAKKTIPYSEGTLKVDSIAFGVVLIGVIIVVAALSFFPALSLGPIAEYFTL